MNDNNAVFDDIMQGLQEVEEYQKGNIELRKHTMTAPGDARLLWHKISGLPEYKRQKVASYVDELLRA